MPRKKRWTATEGTARAALYPEHPDFKVWVPRNDRFDSDFASPPWGPSIAEVMRIRGVEDVDSCGAQSYHVMVKADSTAQLVAAVAHVKARLEALFARKFAAYNGAKIHARKV